MGGDKMDVCEYCELVLGATEKDCMNCYIGNPCIGCVHYENDDCDGQCYFGEEEQG